MSASAWITSIVVGLVLYGGFAWCVWIAVRKGREEHDKASRGGAE
jgi:hypothetical protein